MFRTAAALERLLPATHPATASAHSAGAVTKGTAP